MSEMDSDLPTPSQMPSNLFVNHQGEPIRFRMRPCLERVRLQPFVRAGGGMLNNSVCDSQTIQLVPPGHLTLEERAVSSFYLWACVRAKRMVSMTNFHVAKNSRAPSEEPTVEDIETSSENPSKGRNSYTAGDDEKIINFLKKVKKREYLSQTDMFRRMSQEFNHYHSWESLKNRVRRQLIPRLPHLLTAEELKKVSRLLYLDASSDPSDSGSSSSEDDSSSPSESRENPPLKRSVANLPKPLANFLAFGETHRWTHSQSVILLWMTSGNIEAAKAVIEAKDCSSLLWTPKMDEQLTSGDVKETSAMYKEFGEKELLERVRFLEDCDDNDNELSENFLIP